MVLRWRAGPLRRASTPGRLSCWRTPRSSRPPPSAPRANASEEPAVRPRLRGFHNSRFASLPASPNVLVIFLDRFMGSYVESILRAGAGLADRLSGFTWYPRTVAAGENSIAGVHAMLGGYDYTPVEMNARHESLLDLSTEAFSILPYNFSRRGTRSTSSIPGGLGFTMAGDCSYLAMDGVTCSHIPPSVVKTRAEQMGFPLRKISESSYADLLVLLASMRTAPYLLKEAIHLRGPWRPFLDHSAGTTFRVWAQLKAFPDLTYCRSRPESNLNIVSSILPHEPYFLGEDCLPARRSSSSRRSRRSGRAATPASSRCSMRSPRAAPCS